MELTKLRQELDALKKRILALEVFVGLELPPKEKVEAIRLEHDSAQGE